MKMLKKLIILTLSVLTCGFDLMYYETDSALGKFDDEYGEMNEINQQLKWNYLTNITDFNAHQMTNFEVPLNSWKLKWNQWAKLAYQLIGCPSLSSRYGSGQFKRCRLLYKLKSGIIPSNKTMADIINILRANISHEYSNLNVIVNGKKFIGEDEVSSLMRDSNSANQLEFIWEQWHNASAKQIQSLFIQLLVLLNNTSLSNGESKLWNVWISDLDIEDPLENARELWSHVNPIYRHLHAYVRRKLLNIYGHKYVNITGPIPIYLLRSLWADQWDNVKNIVMPFNRKSNDESFANTTPAEILIQAQRIYESLGFEPLPLKFWKESIFIKNRNVMDCHPLSFDFMNGVDFRVKMCFDDPIKNFDSELRKVIHEFGHIYYFKAYTGQFRLFRSGLNSAFHEAIGDAMALVSNTCKWKHLKSINAFDERDMINELTNEALHSLVLIPWALSMEQWRHDLFVGNVNIEQANHHWWNVRHNIQGIDPPINRQYNIDLDSVSKYHVSNFMPYLRYFFSRFLMHQIHETLCNHEESIHFCCPLSVEEKLRKILSLGSSIPFTMGLYELTNDTEIKSKPLLNYYEPLFEWLKEENRKTNTTIGWD